MGVCPAASAEKTFAVGATLFCLHLVTVRVEIFQFGRGLIAFIEEEGFTGANQ